MHVTTLNCGHGNSAIVRRVEDYKLEKGILATTLC